MKRQLPSKRSGFTQSVLIDGQKIHIRTGEYEDGSLGEIFISMHKEGAGMRAIMSCFSQAVSIGLQHGVPLEKFVKMFVFTRFEPQGHVEGHPKIEYATSVIDLVFRILGIEYLGMEELARMEDSEKHGHHKTSTEINQDEYVASPSDEPVPNATSIPPASDAQAAQLMGDAPMCSECGHITVRSGTCYKCLSCGSTTGCS